MDIKPKIRTVFFVMSKMFIVLLTTFKWNCSNIYDQICGVDEHDKGQSGCALGRILNRNQSICVC